MRIPNPPGANQRAARGRPITDEEREELLYHRVRSKSLGATLAVITTATAILTTFGVWRIKAATDPIDNVPALQDSLRNQTARLRALADTVRLELSLYRTAMDQNTAVVSDLTGTYSTMMQTFPRTLAEATAESRVAAEATRIQREQFQRDFDTQQQHYRTKVSHMERQVDRITEFDARLSGFNRDMSDIRARVLETWTYTLREGPRPQELRGSNTNFRVQVRDVQSEQHLLGLLITHSRTGEEVYKLEDLPVGEEREFAYAGKRYQIHVPWALNAGLDQNIGRNKPTDVFGFELRQLAAPPSLQQAANNP